MTGRLRSPAVVCENHGGQVGERIAVHHTSRDDLSMETIATVSLPIFALLFSGYGAKRLGLLNGASIVGLNGFVYYFALPALFVVKVAESAVGRRFDWRLVAAYHGAGLCVFAVAMLRGRFLFGHRLAVRAWGNVGYMGPPLVRRHSAMARRCRSALFSPSISSSRSRWPSPSWRATWEARHDGSRSGTQLWAGSRASR
jgi:hypothetical protein